MDNSQAANQSKSLHFTLATAGHVDHGKTSILRALTGTDPDRLKEEKEREMTIDLGFAHFQVDKKSIGANQALLAKADAEELIVGFVDVPGHGKFLKNMLAGVGGIDMALLVVAADEGVMPQTIQHVKILTLLGVRTCILVINKTDLAEAEQTQLATEEAHDLLKRFAINILETVPFSCAHQKDTQKLKDVIVAQVLSGTHRDRRCDSKGKPLDSFLAIDRVFSKAGYGAVVTGTLTKGVIRVGDEIAIEPGEIPGRVRGLQTFNRKLEEAYPGQRLAINIALKENKTIERGQAVIGKKIAPISSLIVQLTDLGGLETTRDSAHEKLKPQNIRFYHGTAERYGVIRWIQKLESADENASKDDSVQLRQPVIGQLFLREPVVANPGERFIVRYGDFGIAGGEILLTNRPRWLSRILLKQLCEKIWNHDLRSAAIELINLSPQRSLSDEMLNCLVPDIERARLIDEITKDDEVEQLGDRFITRSERETLVKDILKALQVVATEGEQDKDKSLSQEKLRVSVAPLVDRSVFQNIIRRLIADKHLIKIEERLALPRDNSADPKQGEADSRVSAVASKLTDLLESNLCLETAELVKQIGCSKQDLLDALARLEKDGKAMTVNYDFAASASSLLLAHKALATVWKKHKSINPGDFREELGTNRKYAMAFLAYFDDHQISRRLPSGRVLLKAPPGDQ